MISPKYRELNKERHLFEKSSYESKNEYRKSNILTFLKFSKHSTTYLIIAMLGFLAVIWLIFNLTVINGSPKVQLPCNGKKCQEDLCNEMHSGKISGNLCMELCVSASMHLPNCPESKLTSSKFYSYFSLRGIESLMVCSEIRRDVPLIQPDSEFSELENRFALKIGERIHHRPSVEKITSRIISSGDVNHDGKINVAEANNLWLMLNHKHTFYMLVLAGKSYIPEIKNSCGTLVEIEQILNPINVKSESYLGSVFPMNLQWFWPSWNYRCKISIGILEFFLDSVSLNPNDEFGPDSLYLCAPIASSFGSNFINEAKLTNYDGILNGRDLREKMSDRTCYSDADCVYTEQCQTRCDIKSNTCTSDITKPQIVNYCRFLRDYLLDNANATKILEPIIKSCENLSWFSENRNIMYYKNERPVSYEKHKIFNAQMNYWNNSMDYAILTNNLRTTLWEFVKLTKDPQKTKKKATSNPKPKI